MECSAPQPIYLDDIFKRFAKGKGGPGLYITDEGEAISLGELWLALDDIALAAEGALKLFTALEPKIPAGIESEGSYALMIKMSLEYIMKVHSVIFPTQDIENRPFRVAPNGFQIMQMNEL